MGEKLKKEETKNYKLVSKILGILTRIGSVFCWIGAVALAIVAVGAAIVAPNLKVNRDSKEITLFGETASYDIRDKEIEIGEGDQKVIIKNNEITIGEDGSVVDIKLSDMSIDKIENFIENDAVKFISALPYVLTMVFIGVLFTALALGHCATVLKNIANKETPFTKENIECTEKAARYLIVSYAVVLIANLILDLVIDTNTYHLNLGSITVILGLYIAVYILKYGYSIESKKAVKVEKLEEVDEE